MATSICGAAALRVFDDGWSPPSTQPRPIRRNGSANGNTAEARAGHPRAIGRVNGYPLELRIWPRRPAGVADAVYHPSGYWAAVRVL